MAVILPEEKPSNQRSDWNWYATKEHRFKQYLHFYQLRVVIASTARSLTKFILRVQHPKVISTKIQVYCYPNTSITSEGTSKSDRGDGSLKL